VSESAYFSTHTHFSKLGQSNLFGCANLTVALTKLLVTTIKDSLPGLKHEMEQQKENCEKELKLLGGSVPSDARGRQAVVMQKVSDYCRILRSSYKGDYREAPLSEEASDRIHAYMQISFKKLQVWFGFT
jgi:hypothetical protein